MSRTLNLILSLILFAILAIPLLIISLLVKLTSKGPVMFVSDRVGANNQIFKMYKFRTMRVDTPNVATHLLTHPEEYLTFVGKLLRRTSLDELPQILNVVKGDMNIVGPRPALYNQDDLIELRTKKGVHRLVPGITGWAQVNGRDELEIPVKVEFDEYYLQNRSLWLDVKIILMTVFSVLRSEGVSH